jgi:hypothetical protein
MRIFLCSSRGKYRERNLKMEKEARRKLKENERRISKK